MFECIPNISEGLDATVIDEASRAIESVVGVKLLHTDIGYDANRTVFTFIGDESGIEQAVINLYEVCLLRIDLRKHVGAHPRLGAVDVCPIVPINDPDLAKTDFANAIALSKRIASVVANRFKIPIYLYEKSQDRSYRKNLSAIRRGQFEGLPDKIKHKEWYPDFGPDMPHESFGASVIGARDFLIAFNVSLASKDVYLAKSIAKLLRDYRADLDKSVANKWKGMRAIGWQMPRYDCVQVSTNLIDMSLISLADLFLEIQKLALEKGVTVLGSELIGLIPKRALIKAGLVFGFGSDEAGMSQTVEKLGLSFHSKFELRQRVLESYFSCL